MHSRPPDKTILTDSKISFFSTLSERTNFDKTFVQRQTAGMKPVNIQLVAEELALVWDDGKESYFPLSKLRASCPCASCMGERDLLGNVFKAVTKEGDSSKRDTLVKYNIVGGYALQPVWADGHDTGLYPYRYLRELSGL